MRPSRRRLQKLLGAAAVAALTLFAGCGGGPTRSSDPAAAVRPQIEQLEAAGNYTGIAELYLGLEGSPQQVREWQLLAAEALIEGGDTGRATTVAGGVDQSTLSQAQLTRVRMVLARAALLSGDREAALSNLPPYSGQLPPELQDEVLQVRVEVFAANRLVEDELLDRLTLQRVSINPAVKEANQAALWRLLADIPDEQLQSLVSLDPELAGWVALQEVARIPLNEPDRFSQSMAAWWSRFPAHPAGERARAIERARAYPASPARIALLLPMSGRYAAAGEAIRSGFQTALEQSRSVPPTVIEYDTDLQSVEQLYRQAVLQGADMVVGPLLKANVESLRELPDRQIPVLSLNRAPNAGRERAGTFYQFGLAPEDEADQIARDLIAAGIERTLVIYPLDQWGERVSTAFLGEFEALGGEAVSTATYVPGQPDYSETIKALLQVDRSEARKQRLQSVVGRELGFESRRRRDADAVFLAGFAQSARLIYPQLRFYGLGDMPVVSTSSVYSGQAAQIQDRDLDGIWFVDLPWVLDPDSTLLGRDLLSFESSRATAPPAVADPSRTEASADPATSSAAPPSPRLFALGIDAYAVLPWLEALRESPGTTFEGVTGRLSVDAEGNLVRRLRWARFEDGVAIGLSGAPTPAPVP